MSRDSGSKQPSAESSEALRDAPVILRTENLTKNFDGLEALSSVDLELREGELLGLVGPNGAGKSTFINVLSAQLAPTEGSCYFTPSGSSNEIDITGKKPHEIAELGINRTYQIPRPFPELSVRENVVMGGLFGRSREDEGDSAEEEAMKWIEFTGLDEYMDQPVDSLNLHQRKTLELARSLATRPEVLLVDEVLAGQNPTEVGEGIELIRRISHQGISMIFVEHIMEAVAKLADRIVVLNQGEVIANGPPRDVLNDPVVVKAYLGEEFGEEVG